MKGEMMNNFILQLIAGLNKSKSMEQIKSDAKNLGDIKIPLVGTLNKAKTRAQIKQDLAAMNGTINLTGKFNQKRCCYISTASNTTGTEDSQ